METFDGNQKYTFKIKTFKEILNPCGSFCSNYVAEQRAIDIAITHINQKFDTSPISTSNIVIFTDSLSTLQSLESGRGTDRESTLLTQNLHHLMNQHPVEVVLQWIPGHSGIKGNEAADTLAKRGAALPQPDVPVNYETAVQIIKSNIQEEWLNDWARNTTGRAMYRHMIRPNLKYQINRRQREEQSIIFRLRTGHVQLNNPLSRIKKDHPASCPLCSNPNETVEHLLFHFESFKRLL